ncbi:Uncharacterised protein [Trueperella bialowiezensis]|uniref:Uncharacterized protein n=1 Tax=Trueperella bialowiezensis TaxID=312285 RepID=A0A3S4Z4L3_9ACTO|nr:Uncharacterised protein [Trueperella bialowiezensis]
MGTTDLVYGKEPTDLKAYRGGSRHEPAWLTVARLHHKWMSVGRQVLLPPHTFMGSLPD